jgi:hypothetical protein
MLAHIFKIKYEKEHIYFQAALAAPGGSLSPFRGPLDLAQAAESFMIKTEDFSCFGNLLSFEPSGFLQSS